MPLPRPTVVPLLVSVLVAVGLPLLASPPAGAATPTAGQSTYVPLDPVRLFDTRDGTGGVPVQQVGPGEVLDFAVRGVNSVPDTATAVILNVTATRAEGGTDIRVYPTPTDASFPTVSNLNVVQGVTAANLVTVKIGSGGKVRFRNAGGYVDLLADLSGYFAEGAAGASYTGTKPVRLLDTRESAQEPAYGPGEVRTLTVRGGTTSVPADATAVAVNVTAVSPTRVTDVRLYPTHAGGGPPTVSNLNPAPGGITAAAAVTAIGEDGTISIRNTAGNVHLLVDLAGWYTAGTEANVFHPLDPRRLLDTRSGAALGPGQVRDLVVAGTGAVPFLGRVAVLNVTAIATTSSTDIRVYPTATDASVPNASNINPSAGQTVPNTVLATVGRNGAVRLRNAGGSTHLVVDLSGWYGPAGDGWDISWPQCTTKDSPTSNHPSGGAFAVVGVTRGRPFTANECFADEYAWAAGLPGGAAVYINADAPGTASLHWADSGPRTTCDPTRSTDVNCGWNYGYNLAGYALSRLASLPDKPQVYIDVENGPPWQSGYATAAGVNGNVVIAAINRLRAAGYRVGIYSNVKDWSQIMGALALTNVQNWTFPHSGDTFDPCSRAASFSGGDVVLTQYQVAGESPVYDHNHAC